MVGLMLQDMLGMKKVLKTYMIVLVFYIILGMASGGASQFGAFFVFFSSMIPMSVFAYREKSHWDMYAATMPISRTTMVGATYLLAGVGILAGVVMYAVLVGVDFVQKEIELTNMKDIFVTMEFVTLVGVFYISLMLPILFKFGSERGRMLIVLLYLVPLFIGLMIMKSGVMNVIEDMEVDSLISWLAWGLPVLVVVWVIVTFKISLKIYKKKDL